MENGIIALFFDRFSSLEATKILTFLDLPFGNDMNIFFVIQLFAFFISIILFNRWINNQLVKSQLFDRRYLPCFAWGWSIYLIFYLVSRFLSVPKESFQSYLTGVVFVPLILLAAIWGLRQTANWRWQLPDFSQRYWPFLAVGIFIIIAVYVGPYLEFPSDPVEHLYRIQAWEKALWMDYSSYHPAVTRFAYFIQHWLLHSSDLSFGNRAGLVLLSPLLQGMLFWQFVRLTKLLTNSTVLGCLGGVISLGYFGYSGISFYRYTVLAGALLAYIVFLDGFILIFASFSKEEWRYLFLLPLLLFFCWENHPQETLLQLNAIAGIGMTLFVFRYRTIASGFRRIMGFFILVGVAIAVAICLQRPVLSSNLPEHQSHFLVMLWNLLGWRIQYHGLGMLHQMIGMVGWLSIASALLVLCCKRPSRTLDIMAGACVWPLFFLLNPLLVSFLLRFVDVEVFHRLLYGSLFWLFPILLVQTLYQHFVKSVSPAFVTASGTNGFLAFKLMLNRLILYLPIIFLILLSLIPKAPIYGKMRHVFLRVEDPRLDGRNLQSTIQYLRDRASRECTDPYPTERTKPRSYILSDSYANSYLQSAGYFYVATNRRESGGYESPSSGLTVSADRDMDYATFLQKIEEHKICFVILYVQTQELYSWLGDVVRHWSADHSRTERYYSEGFLEWIAQNPQTFKLVFEDNSVQVFKVLDPN